MPPWAYPLKRGCNRVGFNWISSLRESAFSLRSSRSSFYAQSPQVSTAIALRVFSSSRRSGEASYLLAACQKMRPPSRGVPSIGGINGYSMYNKKIVLFQFPACRINLKWPVQLLAAPPIVSTSRPCTHSRKLGFWPAWCVPCSNNHEVIPVHLQKGMLEGVIKRHIATRK